MWRPNPKKYPKKIYHIIFCIQEKKRSPFFWPHIRKSPPFDTGLGVPAHLKDVLIFCSWKNRIEFWNHQSAWEGPKSSINLTNKMVLMAQNGDFSMGVVVRVEVLIQMLWLSAITIHSSHSSEWLTLPETNSKFAPENRPSQKGNEKVFQPSIVRCKLAVNFREGII